MKMWEWTPAQEAANLDCCDFACEITATDGTWKVVWRFELREWIVHATEVSITQPGGRNFPPQDLAQGLFRSLSVDEARARLSDDPLFIELMNLPRVFGEYPPEVDSPRRGRPRRTNDDHRAVALAYLTEQANREPQGDGSRDGGVLERMRAHFPSELYPEGPPIQTIRGWIRKAEEAKFLSKSGQGKRYRAPGPQLVDWSHLDARQAAMEAFGT